MDLICPNGHPNPSGATQCDTCYEPLDVASDAGNAGSGVGGVDKASASGAEAESRRSSWDPAEPWRPTSPAAAPDIGTQASAQARYGWRMTLPNHAIVPLEIGKLELGRATRDPIGPVLQLFQHVSRHHVTLNVTQDVVMAYVAESAGNPVFAVREDDSGASAAERYQLRSVTRSTSIDKAGRMTLCLGQCCFIRIDRGEA